MKNKGKYIGISNRIPLVVFEYAISDYLKTGSIHSDDYYKYILEFTRGENRAKKTLNHLNSIIKRNDNLLNLLSNSSNFDFDILTTDEKQGLLICLFSLTFPITYDILLSFAMGFKVQEVISKKVIVDKIGAQYGSNRAMHIGVDETMPLLINCDLIHRIKTGLYTKKNQLKINNSLVTEIIVYTDIKLSGQNSILVSEIKSKAWFSYFKFDIQIQNNKFSLFNFQDSHLGGGYLNI